jgi:hypothetical protein
MSTPVKVGGFLVVLAAVFAVAIGAGQAVGPTAGPTTQTHGPEHAKRSATVADDPAATDQPDIPGGLMVSQNGFTLQMTDPQPVAGRDVPLTFTVRGPDGRPVTAYDVEHEKRLHLIAVRRDFSGFQHVHPVLSDDGVWTARLDLTPGPWRLFADFKATGADPLTLGADLSVAGDYQPEPAGKEDRTATVDGYSVTLEGDLRAGADAKLRLSVTKDGRPVTDLEPYLGAYGHLVALREGDLAYLHVHPAGTPGDGTTQAGPDVVFYAAVPSTGSYRLYLDFKHEGVVRTAAFALSTSGDAETSPGPTHADEGHGH